MADIQKDLENWLGAQPEWLQLATERYLSAGALSDTDVKDCVKTLKSSGVGRAVVPSRSYPTIAQPSHAQGPIRLVSIGSISGIENLGPREPLDFGNGDLCVIYGPNGSGKSSYTRLLKKMCGKPGAKELKPNVFKPAPSQRGCEIRYSVAGAVRATKWQANGPPLAELNTVDLFDSEEAVAYLSNETAVTYTPPAVAMLETLAAFCDRVKIALQNEQDLLVSTLPALPTEYASTKTGATWKQIASASPEKRRGLTSWDVEDEKELQRLSERLKVEDPAALAHVKRGAKSQIESLVLYVGKLADALVEENLTTIRALRQDAEAKRRSANESAKVTRGELDGIGTDTWRALWRAARDYSQDVYPRQQFPVTEEARCLLCHQHLDATAQARLNEFESFVQGKLETEAAEAKRTYEQALQQLPAVLSDSEIATRCQAAHMDDQELIHALRALNEEATKSRGVLMDGEPAETATALERPTTLLDTLRRLATTLENNAVEYEADAAGFDRVAATVARTELEARRWTSQQSVSIQLEGERLKEVEAYEKWKKLASSSSVSRKATELAEKAITEAYVERFNAELKKLGAAKVKVELCKSKTTKGKVLHKIRLKGTVSEHPAPDGILSEGERRIITLAAFLADVANKPYAAPFIFDDPISSLDHDFEWAVAVRLVELAKERQVLVLTHRLSLFGMLDEAAKTEGDSWKKEHLMQRFIESFNGVAGHPSIQEISSANTQVVNNILITNLNDAKRAGDASGGSSYRALAQSICCDFRKLIERTIEDDLLNQIVRRHRRGVQTNNRLPLLTRISAKDCAFFDSMMTKYSSFVHSHSTEAPVVIPEYDELLEDLNSLNTWRKEFKSRKKS